MAKRKNLDINNISAIMEKMVVNFDNINKGLESVADRFGDFNKQIQVNAAKVSKDAQKSDNAFLEALKQKTGAVGTFAGKIEGLIKSFKDQSAATVIATVSLGGLSLVVTAISALYDRFIAIQQRFAAAMGTAAMATGASARQFAAIRTNIDELRGTMSNLTDDMTGITVSGEEVVNTLNAMHEGAGRIGFGEGSLGQSLVAVSRGFGLGAEGAANLFRMVTQGSRDPNAAFQAFAADITNFSDAIGVNAGQVVKDMNDSRPAFAQFGRDAVNVFKNAEMEANQFGYSAQKIFDMMKGFDTFSSAADNVNKLNAMFGTSLNSLELMEEQDPAKRLELIRSQLRGAGFDFEHMSRQQVQMLSQVTGESADVIQRVFGDGQSLAQLQQQQARAAAEQLHQQKQQTSNQEMMNSLLQRTTTVFMTIDRLFGQMFNDLSQDLAPAFEEIHSVAMELTKEFTEWVKKITKTPEFHDAIKDIAKWIRESAEWLKRHLPTWEQIKNVVEKVGPILGTIWDGIAKISDMLGPEGTMIVGLGLLAAFTFSGPISGIASLIGSLGTVASMVGGGGPIMGGLMGMAPLIAGIAAPLAVAAAIAGGASATNALGESQNALMASGTTGRRRGEAERQGGIALEELQRREGQSSLGFLGGAAGSISRGARNVQAVAGGLSGGRIGISGADLDIYNDERTGDLIHRIAIGQRGSPADIAAALRQAAPQKIADFERARHQSLEAFIENERMHSDLFANPSGASAINSAPVVAPTATANTMPTSQPANNQPMRVSLQIDHKELGNALVNIPIGGRAV